MENSDFVNNISRFSRIDYNRKFSQILPAKYIRLFHVDYWKNGVCLAHAEVKRKSDVALSVTDWVINDWSIKEFSERYSFVEFNEGSFEYELGKDIEFAWNRYLKNIPSFEPELMDFVVASSKDEVLSNLFPFISMHSFCFSRCTGYPYSYDCPYVESKDGNIIVFSSEGKIIEKTNVQNAIEIIKDNLPRNCGRAIRGTSEDL